MFSMNDNILTASPSASPHPFRLNANGGAVAQQHKFSHYAEGNGEKQCDPQQRFSKIETAYLSYYQPNMRFFADDL